MTTPLPMRALGAAIVLALVALPACATQRAATPAPLDSATCSAIAAAVDSLVVGHQAVRVGLVAITQPVRRRGMPADMWKRIEELPGLDSSTLHAFERNNASPAPSCATLPLLGGTRTLTDAELDSLRAAHADADDYWRAFRAKYPGLAGVTSTSGVGIGAGGRQALLMLDHGCDSLCGAGHIVLLERDEQGKWRVKRAEMTWVS